MAPVRTYSKVKSSRWPRPKPGAVTRIRNLAEPKIKRTPSKTKRRPLRIIQQEVSELIGRKSTCSPNPNPRHRSSPSEDKNKPRPRPNYKLRHNGSSCHTYETKTSKTSISGNDAPVHQHVLHSKESDSSSLGISVDSTFDKLRKGEPMRPTLLNRSNTRSAPAENAMGGEELQSSKFMYPLMQYSLEMHTDEELPSTFLKIPAIFHEQCEEEKKNVLPYTVCKNSKFQMQIKKCEFSYKLRARPQRKCYTTMSSEDAQSMDSTSKTSEKTDDQENFHTDHEDLSAHFKCRDAKSVDAINLRRDTSTPLKNKKSEFKPNISFLSPISFHEIKSVHDSCTGNQIHPSVCCNSSSVLFTDSNETSSKVSDQLHVKLSNKSAVGLLYEESSSLNVVDNVLNEYCSIPVISPVTKKLSTVHDESCSTSSRSDSLTEVSSCEKFKGFELSDSLNKLFFLMQPEDSMSISNTNSWPSHFPIPNKLSSLSDEPHKTTSLFNISNESSFVRFNGLELNNSVQNVHSMTEKSGVDCPDSPPTNNNASKDLFESLEEEKYVICTEEANRCVDNTSSIESSVALEPTCHKTSNHSQKSGSINITQDCEEMLSLSMQQSKNSQTDPESNGFTVDECMENSHVITAPQKFYDLRSCSQVLDKEFHSVLDDKTSRASTDIPSPYHVHTRSFHPDCQVGEQDCILNNRQTTEDCVIIATQEHCEEKLQVCLPSGADVGLLLNNTQSDYVSHKKKSQNRLRWCTQPAFEDSILVEHDEALGVIEEEEEDFKPCQESDSTCKIGYQTSKVLTGNLFNTRGSTRRSSVYSSNALRKSRFSHVVIPGKLLAQPRPESLSFRDLYGITSNETTNEPSLQVSDSNLAIHKEEITNISWIEEKKIDCSFTLTARDVVLQRCNQDRPFLFSEAFSETFLNNCRKIGEGAYGEVFMWQDGGESTVIKIIPIEGEELINGERQKKFGEILSEIVISMELSNLRNGNHNQTNCFARNVRNCCIQDKYPEKLVELWNQYAEEGQTENDCPEVFPVTQLFIVLELANGGKDMEQFIFNNAKQALSILMQTAYALAIAERCLEFEHRDLHWGNVLISRTQEKYASYKLDGRTYVLPTDGVQVTIIDFTLSRMTYDGCCIFNDLSQDPSLFASHGDYQFEIYRQMQKACCDNWNEFVPFNNILWLDYLLEKMVSKVGVHYRNSKSKVHQKGLKKLEEIRRSILESYSSATAFVETEHTSS